MELQLTLNIVEANVCLLCFQLITAFPTVASVGTAGQCPWWTREGELPGFVRDAHSIYFESFGELGVIGFLLIVGFVGTVFVGAAARTLRTRDPRLRATLAAATGAVAAFALTAGIDWSWEQPVLAFCFLLLGAAALTGDAQPQPRHPSRAETTTIRQRAIAGGATLLALAVITPPLLEEHFLRESEQAVRDGRTDDALSNAESAAAWQPWASEPYLQQALDHEIRGELDEAAADAKQAIERSETDWQSWFILARIESERDNPAELLNAYRRARELNPRSPLFAES